MAATPSRNEQALEELQTVRDWVRFYVSEMQRHKVFLGHGSSHVLDEAVYLVQSALNLPIEDVSPYLEARVLKSERVLLCNYLAQRTEERKPASYITGQAWLQGQAFKVDPRVIIPRSFISEILADQITPWVNNPDRPFRILDLCTGSGCLAILAAMAFPHATVDAVDLSPAALEVARENIHLHNLSERVHAIESDLFDSLTGNQYDIIITNPPYVNESSMKALPPEYLHEPRMALAGGDDGMQLIERIMTQAPAFLTDEGFLILELGNEKPYFDQAFPDLSPTWLETSAGDEQVFLMHQADF